MISTIVITVVIVLLSCAALALGQFFGRKPIEAKCNPGNCCMKGDDCDKMNVAASIGERND